MLNQLRRSASSLPAKILMALLVLSFAVWGIGDALNGYGEDTIAEVGGTEVSLQQFQNEYARSTQSISQRLGQPMSPQLALQLGLPQQVLGRLVSDAVIANVADNLGLGISDEELVRQIQADPTFQRQDGTFDRDLMLRLLAANNFGEQAYVEAMRGLALRRQIAEGLVGGMTAPETLVQAADRYANEERTIRGVVLTTAMVETPGDPTEEALQAFFDAHKAEFRAPEYRGFTVITLDPAAIVDPSTIPEEEVVQAYEAAQTRFGTPERRHVYQIRFPDKAQADAAAAALRGGAPLAQILTERGLSEADVDLGTVAKTGLVDPVVADAAFSLDKGGVAVVEGRFGPAVVEVAEIEPAGIEPLESVADTLRTELASRKSAAEAMRLQDEIEDARAAGETLKEIAAKFDLPIIEIPPVDAEGAAADGGAKDIPERTTLLPAVFAAEPDTETDPVEFGKLGGTQWFELGEIVAPRDRTLDEVRPQVLAAWRGDAEAKALAALSSATAEEVRTGVPLDDIAARHGTTVQNFGPFKRSATVEGLSSQAVTAAFEGGMGSVHDAAGPTSDRIVFVVEGITTPAFFAEAQTSQELANQLADGIGNALLAEFITDRETDAGVSVNQPALNRAIGMDRIDQ